jgi:Ca2+-binding EF-hand superfamily protein
MSADVGRLVEACTDGDAATVRELMKKGVDPNYVDPESEGTVLMVAALNGHADCLEALIDAGADLEVEHPTFNMTAFHWACYNAHLMCVEMLVHGKCDAMKRCQTPTERANGEPGKSGQELARDNMRPGWENIVQFLQEATNDRSLNIDKELEFSTLQKRRMRKTLGGSEDNDALSLLFTTEQTKQGGRRSTHTAGQTSSSGAMSSAEALKQKELELRKSLSPERVTNLYKVVEDRLAEAAIAEQIVSGLLHTIAGACNGRLHGLQYKFKSRDSTFNKVLRKSIATVGTVEEQDAVFVNSVGQLRDLLRYTLVTDTDGYVAAVHDCLRTFKIKGIKTTNLKNFWRRKGQEADYLGINGSFIEQGGFPFELQFHTEESITMKEGDAHVAYEQFRLTTGEQKYQHWEMMVRVWSLVPLPPGDLFSIGEKSLHNFNRQTLTAELSEEARERIEKREAMEGKVRPACDRVYRANLIIEKQLTGPLQALAKQHRGKTVGDEHIIKSSLSMTRKCVSQLINSGWWANDTGIEQALDEIVLLEARNGLRYTFVFPTETYTAATTAVLKMMTANGFQENLVNNYWLGKEPYNAVRARMFREMDDAAGGDDHWVAFVFHTPTSLEMSEERMVKLQDAMGIVIHTATLTGDEASVAKREEAERQMGQDHSWMARCADLSAKRPAQVLSIGKVIVDNPGKPESPVSNTRRGSLSIKRTGSMRRVSGSTIRDKRDKARSAISETTTEQSGSDATVQLAQTCEPGVAEGVPPEVVPSVDDTTAPTAEVEPQQDEGVDAIIVEILTADSLQQYLPKLLENQLHKAHILHKTKPADLKAIGIKAGHAKRILKLLHGSSAFEALAEEQSAAASTASPEPAVQESEPEPEPESEMDLEPEPQLKPSALAHNVRLGGSIASRMQAMEQVWKRIDADSSGSLDRDELAAMLTEIGLPSDDEHVSKVMEEIDADRNGTIDHGEFVQWFARQDTTVQDELYDIYYEKDGTQVQTKLSKLPDLLEVGVIQRSTHIWVEGMTDWMELSSCIDSALEGVSTRVQGVLQSADAHARMKLLKNVWARADKDKSGSLDRDEVHGVLEAMMGAVSKRKLDQAIRDMDTDCSGLVDFEEFCCWFTAQDIESQEQLITVHYQALNGEVVEALLAEIPGLIDGGTITAKTLIWVDGMDEWSAIEDAKQVAHCNSGRRVSSLKAVLETVDSDSQRKMCEKVWARVDSDGNGSLDRSEMHEVLVAMGGPSVSKRKLDKAMKEMGTDASGQVQFDAFLQWFTVQDASSQEHLIMVHYQGADGAVAEATMASIPELLAAGEILHDTLIWIDGMDDWVEFGVARASGVAGLSEALADAVSSASIDVQHKLLEKIWQRADTDGNGELDIEEVRHQ